MSSAGGRLASGAEPPGGGKGGGGGGGSGEGGTVGVSSARRGDKNVGFSQSNPPRNVRPAPPKRKGASPPEERAKQWGGLKSQTGWARGHEADVRIPAVSAEGRIGPDVSAPKKKQENSDARQSWGQAPGRGGKGAGPENTGRRVGGGGGDGERGLEGAGARGRDRGFASRVRHGPTAPGGGERWLGGIHGVGGRTRRVTPSR